MLIILAVKRHASQSTTLGSCFSLESDALAPLGQSRAALTQNCLSISDLRHKDAQKSTTDQAKVLIDLCSFIFVAQAAPRIILRKFEKFLTSGDNTKRTCL
jgi:hypothetical protein